MSCSFKKGTSQCRFLSDFLRIYRSVGWPLTLLQRIFARINVGAKYIGVGTITFTGLNGVTGTSHQLEPGSERFSATAGLKANAALTASANAIPIRIFDCFML